MQATTGLIPMLFALAGGAKRFGVLRSQMGRMSQKTLVAELRALEQLGAVERIVFASRRSSAALTEAVFRSKVIPPPRRFPKRKQWYFFRSAALL